MTSLAEAVAELGRGADDARAAWRATRATVSDIWRTMMSDDDTLRNFYLNVYNDVSDVTSRAGALARQEVKKRYSPYSITERRVPELIPVHGSQPAGDVSHKPDGGLPLLSDRSPVVSATIQRAAASFAAW